MIQCVREQVVGRNSELVCHYHYRVRGDISQLLMNGVLLYRIELLTFAVIYCPPELIDSILSAKLLLHTQVSCYYHSHT